MYVPVNFGEEENVNQPDEPQPGMEEDKKDVISDGCVYDIMGRKVATEQETKDGTWRYRLSPGVYIINGRKVICAN